MAPIESLSTDNIFPRFIKEYKDVVEGITSLTNPFRNVCIHISNKLYSEKINSNFLNSCIKLSNYLNHIKNKTEDDRVSYCKYFNFKIKDELEYLKPNCGREKSCYEEIVSTTDTTSQRNIKVPDSCKDHIQDLDHNTFSLFQKLENLYSIQYNIFNIYEGCQHGSRCFNNYKELCKICQSSNNEGLRSVLDKFKEEHLQNVDAPSCIKPPKYLLSSSIRTVLLTSFIITLSIPFIAFILYEYTPCGLYLQQSIRKLKDIWSKKRREEQQLINTFENTYDDLVDKWSKVSYGAIDCN